MSGRIKDLKKESSMQKNKAWNMNETVEVVKQKMLMISLLLKYKRSMHLKKQELQNSTEVKAYNELKGLLKNTLRFLSCLSDKKSTFLKKLKDSKDEMKKTIEALQRQEKEVIRKARKIIELEEGQII